MLVANSPLFIEDLSGNNSEVQRGSLLKRRIVIKNLGDRSAEVDVWIVATNKKSEPLLRWCTFSESNPIHLQSRESREVTLIFEVPPQATPDLYSYEVLVDAQGQYPDKPPLRRPQQLRVLPSNQDGEWGNEPIFSLYPVTHSANPHHLQAGETLDVKVSVKNCSKRVDRYFLTCPEWSKTWFTVQYPESSLDTSGLVRETDGLELNPGGTGEILLKLHPPQYTPAGNYFPTLRLTSSNKEGLVLLDVVYLEILPTYRLEARLTPIVQRFPSESGQFVIDLTNHGNTERHLTLQASDRAHLFTYSLTPASIHLAPGTTEQIQLTTAPKHRWRRPLWGNGLEFPIDLVWQDIQPSGAKSSDLNQSPTSDLQATLLWEARPWWVLLLLILAGLGSIGTFAFLVWLLLFKPTPVSDTSPKIIQFDPAIDPVTQQKRTYRDGDPAIELNWKISQLQNIQTVTVVRLQDGAESDRKTYSFAGTIPQELQRNTSNRYCEKAKIANTDGLSCLSIPVPIRGAGAYTFKLQVFTRQNPHQPTDSMITDTISVEPMAMPQILELAPTQPTYRASKSPVADGLIRLNWEISNASNIKEVNLIGLAADGSISTGLKRYAIAGNTLPPELSPFCTLNTNLICRNLPTPVQTAGNYTFKLAVVPQQGQQSSTLEKSTPVIKIQAFPPKILAFRINGQDVKQKPKYVYEFGKGKSAAKITLSWQVEDGDDIKVELLPAPGLVPLQGAIDYPLSHSPSRETLTLRVTNRLGEQVSQAIVLETVEANQTDQPQSASAPKINPSIQTIPGGSSIPPNGSRPGKLTQKP